MVEVSGHFKPILALLDLLDLLLGLLEDLVSDLLQQSISPRMENSKIK